jgi:CheY-like chemotaxis protein
MASFRGTRVSVIDDSAEFLQLIGDFLADAGCRVEAFQGDDVDLSTLAATRPDLVILDLRLKPGGQQLTGWEFLVLIRSHAELLHVPVVICSADLSELQRRQAELAGMARTFVMPKPFELAQLEALMRGILDGRPGPAEDD